MSKYIVKLIGEESDSDYEVPAKRQTRSLSPIKPEKTLNIDPKVMKNALKSIEKNDAYVEKIVTERNIDVPSRENI